MKKYIILTLLLIHATHIIAITSENNTTVKSCDRQLTFNAPPKRAVSHDINLTEMMFALQLQKHMVGYSGVSGWQKLTDEFKMAAGDLPQISEKDPSLESLLAMGTDFLFAGWNYGLRVGGPLSPSSLNPFGIEVYELTESCIHIMSKKAASFNDVYNDLSNLGKIFSVEARANVLIESYKHTIAGIENKVKDQENISAFVYDSGKSAPFTAARHAIPNAMITAAGGKNIMGDIQSSWLKTSWESVVNRNPDIIIIVDYGKETAEDKINFLKQHPALTSVNAIIHDRFVTLSYAEATPGIRNFSATQRLAQAFHPKLFSAAIERQ